MNAKKIPVVGIVGGIGSGKSTLSKALQNYFKTARLDADQVGHQVLQDPSVRKSLADHFGSDILDESGAISRAALAKKVFGDTSDVIKARKTLEQLVHPAIHDRLLQQMVTHQNLRDCQIIVLDAALLFEAGWTQHCDAIVFLEVTFDERLRRVQQRGWTESDLIQREKSQLSLNEKRSRSDFVVQQSETIEQVASKVADWLQEKFDLDGIKAFKTGK